MAVEELKLNDRLALERTLMVSERTIMAWVRTAVSLMSFGFTMYKVQQQFASEGLKRLHPDGRYAFFLTGAVAYTAFLLVLSHLEGGA